ncbi:FxSxx-COOH system tetratricopeptide repeat protein [Nonomuraea spiralis]|uniref:FxSxx-COOH system tetratricopeptide repeat protein n=1 Tax=Nonomuraea spiralis TaxID=46182 RepID=UPI0037A089A1
MSADEGPAAGLEIPGDRPVTFPPDEPPDRLLAQVLMRLFQQVASARELSQNGYAARIYQSPASVSRWLRGKRVPPAQFVEQLIRDVEEATEVVIPPDVRASIEDLHVRALAAVSPAVAKEQAYVYRLHQAQDRVQEAEATISLLQAEVVSLEDKVKQRDAEIRRIKERHRQAATHTAEIIADYETRVRRLEDERDELDADLTRMKVSVERYESERERARQESERLETALAEIQHTMTVADGGDEPAVADVPAGHEVVVEPDRQPAVWERVPLRNRNFTGREQELRRIRDDLRSSAQPGMPQAVVLQGMIGVGKTQLAIEYAWRNRASYDLVSWISADSPALLAVRVAAMAPLLGLPQEGAGREETVAGVVKALGQGRPYARWLLVFDQAVDPRDVLDLLPPGPGHILITSRNPEWEGPYEVHRVECFPREESVSFLRRRLGVDLGEESDRLAAELGDLPLALEQTAVLQIHTGISIEECLPLLRQSPTELLNMSRPHDYPSTLPAACAASIARLAEESPDAVTFMWWCALLGPAPVPRAFFRRLPPGRMREILSDSLRLSRILRSLTRLALVRLEPAGGMIHVHRLVQVLCRADLPEAMLAQSRQDVCRLLAVNTPDDPGNPAGWPAFRALTPHVVPTGLIGWTEPEGPQAALRVTRYLCLSGDYERASAFLRVMDDEWNVNERDLHLFAARSLLTDLLRALGQYTAAYKLSKENVSAMRDELGGDHPETLAAVSGFGGALRACGRFLEARHLHKESLRDHERHLGPDEPETLRVMSELAHDHGLTGDHATAVELFRRAHAGQTTGPRRAGPVDVLVSLSGLARELRLNGHHVEARAVGEDAYAQGAGTLGAEHHLTLLAAKDLAIAVRRCGAVEQALDLARETHLRLRLLLGDEHPDTLAAAITLSNSLRWTGRVEEALTLARHAVAGYADALGPDHPFSHASGMTVALLSRLCGVPATSELRLRRAHAGLVETLGQAHDLALACAVNLQSDLLSSGAVAEARAFGEVNLAHARKALGEDHPLTLACAANHALDLAAEGSGDLYAETVERYRRVLGPEHPETVIVREGGRVHCDFDPVPL